MLEVKEYVGHGAGTYLSCLWGLRVLSTHISKEAGFLLTLKLDKGVRVQAVRVQPVGGIGCNLEVLEDINRSKVICVWEGAEQC